MVLPDSDRVSRVPSYSGIIPGWLGFRLRGCHPLWPAFPGRSTIQTAVPRCDCRRNRMTLQPHSYNAGRLAYEWFGLIPVRSPLLGESRLIYFPEGTEMFQFPSFATSGLCIQPEVTLTFLSVGFPIRKSTDQRLLTAPRGLSQFCHVLLRLLVPRHPPNALTSLTTKTFSSVSSALGFHRARHRQNAPADGQVTVFVRLAFVGEGHLRSNRISQTQVPTAMHLITRCRFGVLGLMRCSTPFRCLLPAPSGSQADASIDIRASRFVQLFDFHTRRPEARRVSSGPGKT